MDKNELLTRLEGLILEVYTKKEEFELLVADATPELSKYINFNIAPIYIMGQILVEADKVGNVGRIIEFVVTRNKKNRPKLLETELLYYISQLSLPLEELKKLYRRSRANIPGRSEFPGDDETTIRQLLEMKVQIDIDKGVKRSPIFDFVERLAYLKQDEAIATDLRKWIERAFCYITPELNREDIRDRRAHILEEERREQASAGQRISHLLIELSPTLVGDSESYNVTFIFIDHLNNEKPWDGSDEPIPLYKVPDLIATRLDENEVDHVDDLLTLEFILPFQLFQFDIDQRENLYATMPHTPFGADHPIVIRSLFRLQKRKHWRNWQQRWEYFKDGIDEYIFNDVPWIDKADLDPTNFSYALLTEEQIRNIHCIAFSFYPKEPENQPGIFTALVNAGIVAAVWPRQCPDIHHDSTSVQKHVNEIFSEERLFKIAGTLKDKRLYCIGDKHDLTNHIMVMWDNPDRIPKRYRTRYK